MTAERNVAATVAPSKASLLETQPQSIITHQYIEQATPESGDYTTAVIIAPSVSVHRIQEAQTTVYQVLWELTLAALDASDVSGPAGPVTNEEVV